jgi:mRNA-degrading endonuclease RelE of RelBE toxin-antitoxin system
VKVLVGRAAAAEVGGLPPAAKARLKKAILAIATDPRGRKRLLDVKRLRTARAESNVYRVRAGEWRIVYRLVGQTAEVVRVFHRSEGDAWMETLGI